VQAWLLIFILSFYTWSLGKDVITLKHWRQANAASEKLRVAYGQPEGIDVYGKLIVVSSLSAKKYIVFLLRNENLQNDINFWSRVEMLLNSHREIGLIGYCDSQQCVESIRKRQPLAFPILSSGDATGVEAVVNADADGKAILKSVGSHTPSTILWRATISPQEFVQEAIR
jgi:hypothetical protein